MTDLLQENLLYLYKYESDIFNKIQKYIEKFSSEKYYKLDFNAYLSPNISYVTDGKESFLYQSSDIDISDWTLEHPYIIQGKYDVVFFGLGLAYHLVKLIEINSSLNFYIIEPEIDIFLEALKVINIDQLLEHPQVRLFTVGNTDEDFQNFIYMKNLYSLNERVNLYLPYHLSLNDDIKRYYSMEYDGITFDVLSKGFESEFGKLPYRNSIKNIFHLNNSHALQLLKHKFPNCTALIVGAGPSLEKDIEYIKQAEENLLIIAAGSSIQSLLHYGIKPHLIVSMDPGEANGKIFDLVDASEIPFVFINQIYYEIMDKRINNNYHAYFKTDPITEYIFNDLSLSPKLIPTPSVSGTAVQVAVYLGATTVMFAGQDLSFPNMQYYAAGAKHLDSNQLLSSIKKNEHTVENVQGGKNNTNLSMKLTKENIEGLIDALENIKFINTSSLGAVIKGADFIPFIVAIGDISERKYDFAEIKKTLQLQENINEFSTEDIVARIEKFNDSCDHLIEKCLSSKKIISKIDEACRHNPVKAMSLLNKLEAEFSLVTEDKLFKTIITNWSKGWTRLYDQQVINIKKESSIVKKSKLLNGTVIPYIKIIVESAEELKNEFSQLKTRILKNETQ